MLQCFIYSQINDNCDDNYDDDNDDDQIGTISKASSCYEQASTRLLNDEMLAKDTFVQVFDET